MGYRSYFSLAIEGSLVPVDLRQIHKSLEKISGYDWEIHYDNITLNDVTWYEHEADMAKLSEAYPDVKFELYCRGEDGDEQIIDAFTGAVHVRQGMMIFDKRTLWK